MKHRMSLLIALMAVAPSTAWGQEVAPSADPADVDASTAVAGDPAVPPSAPPAAAPMQAAPEQVPAPPAPVDSTAQAAVEAQPPSPPPGVPSGQWAYTSQYGWVWMPYAQTYTYVPEYGDPYMYVYYPSYGWQWVVAPWVFGWGPTPHWGSWGVRHFAWHSRPWFQHRAFHGSRAFAVPNGHFRPHAGVSAGIVVNHGAVRSFNPGVHRAHPVGHSGGGAQFGGHGGHGGRGHNGGGHGGGAHGGGGHGGGHGGHR